jgi:hypothetical protein
MTQICKSGTPSCQPTAAFFRNCDLRRVFLDPIVSWQDGSHRAGGGRAADPCCREQGLDDATPKAGEVLMRLCYTPRHMRSMQESLAAMTIGSSFDKGGSNTRCSYLFRSAAPGRASSSAGDDFLAHDSHRGRVGIAPRKGALTRRRQYATRRSCGIRSTGRRL